MAIASSLSKARAPILSSVSGYLKIVKNGKNRCPLLSSAIINPSPKGEKGQVPSEGRGNHRPSTLPRYLLYPLTAAPKMKSQATTKKEPPRPLFAPKVHFCLSGWPFSYPLGSENSPSQKVYCCLVRAHNEKGKVEMRKLNARIRNEKYKPKRVFLETLTGYIEAARVRTLDQWWDNARRNNKPREITKP